MNTTNEMIKNHTMEVVKSCMFLEIGDAINKITSFVVDSKNFKSVSFEYEPFDLKFLSHFILKDGNNFTVMLKPQISF
jgi:hypothetical protein